MKDEAIFSLEELVKRALYEDIGPRDITTDILFPRSQREAKAIVLAKDDLILAGSELFFKTFEILEDNLTQNNCFRDGDEVKRGDKILEIKANISTLLKGERVALNFLQRLSGIASLTRRYVEKIKGYGVTLLDTRKTTPGLRSLEKYAVRAGGGRNHRFGLFDGILIKDNHIKACGGIKEALRRIKENLPPLLKIEVETQDLKEVAEALEAGVDVIMLDNMTPDEIREAMRIIGKKALVEISGGINLENIEGIAKLGVDFISVGALTHSYKSADISMEIEL